MVRAPRTKRQSYDGSPFAEVGLRHERLRNEWAHNCRRVGGTFGE